jgi:hypothetical protein
MTKEEILVELTASRGAVLQGCAALRAEFDLKAKLNNLVRKKPYAWLGGAAALGWILAGPKSKTRVVTKTIKPNGVPAAKVDKKTKRAGLIALLFALVRFVLPVLRPAVTTYAGRRLADMVTKFTK